MPKPFYQTYLLNQMSTLLGQEYEMLIFLNSNFHPISAVDFLVHYLPPELVLNFDYLEAAVLSLYLLA